LFGKRDQDPLISLAQVIGSSIAIVALLAEGVFFLGARFSWAAILILLSLFAGLAVVGIRRRGIQISKGQFLALGLGLALFGLTVAWRLFQARDLLLPNWVDSQHHFLIIRAILDKGGLPADLTPYLEGPFYYHYGFHILTALFTALSGLEIAQGMLVLGQVLNAAISLSVYSLGKSLWKDWRPAAAAALLTSFATRMPAYYLSWGRYTLTTGLVLLPLAMGLAITLLKKKDYRWTDAATLSLLTAGVLLSHYFTGVLLAIFLTFLGIVHLITHRKAFKTAIACVLKLTLHAGIGLLLAAPWLWRVVRFSQARTGVSSNLPPSLEGLFNGNGDGGYIWQLLGPTSNHWLLPVAGMGLILALITNRKRLEFALWSLLLAVMTLPWSFAVAPFRPDHFAIILFLPVVLWTGWLFWQLGRWVARKLGRRWVTSALTLVLVVGLIAWSFSFSKNIVNPVTVLVTEDDLAALIWVRENTPADARFFINTTHWLSGVYRGTDGGGWLLPLTGRWALVPTVFYGFSNDAGYKTQLREWGERASAITTCDAAFWALVEEAGLDWIYVREGVGSLTPEGLVDCTGVEGVYTDGQITIYTIGQ
jgi:hypothetical protein